MGGSFGPAPEAPLLPAEDEELALRSGDTEVRFDVTWVAGGTLQLQPDDARLPAAPWDMGGTAATTEEQKRFGAETRVTVRGPGGARVIDVTGIRRMDMGHDGWRA